MQALGGFVRKEAQSPYFKGVSLAGLVSTLVVAYFQNLSAYHDKVATQAKEDLTAATQTFADASTSLSAAISLQRRLIADFYAAVPNDVYKNDAAYLTKDARAVYKNYTDAYSALHQNYNLLARKTEIYLDWPSNPFLDSADNTSPTTDTINMSNLGAYNFDCENNMPSFVEGQTTVSLPDPNKKKDPLRMDWRSGKHSVLAIQYCFDVTHTRMTAALQWGAQTDIEPAQWTYFTSADHADLFNNIRPVNQVLRLNAFMSLAMSEIEQIRVKYRPNGFLCTVPGLSGMIGFAGQLFHRAGPAWCTPVRTTAL